MFSRAGPAELNGQKLTLLNTALLTDITLQNSLMTTVQRHSVLMTSHGSLTRFTWEQRKTLPLFIQYATVTDNLKNFHILTHKKSITP